MRAQHAADAGASWTLTRLSPAFGRRFHETPLISSANVTTTTAEVGATLGHLQGADIHIASGDGNLQLIGLELAAAGNLTTYSGGATLIDSSRLAAEGELSVFAEGELRVRGLTADPTETAPMADTLDGRTTPTSRATQLSAGADLHLAGITGIDASGLDIQGRDVSLAARGDIVIAGGNLHQAWGGRNDQHIRDHGQAARIAARNLDIEAGGEHGNIELVHVEVATRGATRLLARGDIRIDPGTDYRYDYTRRSRSSGFIAKKTTVAEHLRETLTILPSRFAAGRFEARAGGNLTLTATGIVSQATPTLAAAGDIQYLAAHHRSVVRDERRSSRSLLGLTYRRSSDLHSEMRDTALVTDIQSQADVLSASGGDTTLEGSRIVSASGRVDILAGGNLDIRPAEKRLQVEDRHEEWSLVSGNPFKNFEPALNPVGGLTINHSVDDARWQEQTTLTGAHLEGSHIALVAGANLQINAGELLGREGVELTAGGSVLIEAGEQTESRAQRHAEAGFGFKAVVTSGRLHFFGPNWNTDKARGDEATTTPVASRIAAEEGNVTVRAGGDIGVIGSLLDAGQDLRLDAGGSVAILGGESSHRLDEHKQAGTLFFAMRDGRELQTQSLAAVPSELRAGGDIALASGDAGRILLGGVDIASGARLNLDTPALDLIAERNLEQVSRRDWDKDGGYAVNEGKGHVSETLTLARIEARGIELPATAKVAIQLDGQALDPAANAAAAAAGSARLADLSPAQFEALARQLALQPGMAYLAELAQRPDIDWQAVSTAHQQWDYKTQGLTQAGAVVLTVVVAILSAGAGSSLAGTTTAAASGGTTTTLAGTTLATTTAVGATTYTFAGWAVNAGFSTLASSAAVSFANNNGDLGSSETVKTVLASMLTAGVGQHFSGTYNLDSQGRVQFNGSLSAYLESHPELRSPMGGWQGGVGKFAFFNYQPGSFWDRLAEAYAGPHDKDNSFIWYDSTGNIRSGVNGTWLGTIGDITNYANVLLATPFALSTLIQPEILQAIRVGMNANKMAQRP